MEEYTFTEEVTTSDLRYKTQDCLDKPYGDLKALVGMQPIQTQLAYANAPKTIEVVCEGLEDRCKWLEDRHDKMEALVTELGKQNLKLSTQLGEFIEKSKGAAETLVQLTDARKRQRLENLEVRCSALDDVKTLHNGVQSEELKMIVERLAFLTLVEEDYNVFTSWSEDNSPQGNIQS